MLSILNPLFTNDSFLNNRIYQAYIKFFLEEDSQGFKMMEALKTNKDRKRHSFLDKINLWKSIDEVKNSLKSKLIS